MKQVTNRNWQSSRLTRPERSAFDPTTALGSLAVALLAYIVYHIYPLISKGLLWQ